MVWVRLPINPPLAIDRLYRLGLLSWIECLGYLNLQDFLESSLVLYSTFLAI